ncbi:LOW QUALITY PROTEIN: putative diacylglycerol O-acyltransferase 2-like protein DGAT2L7P [Callorhinus ursinus]|uniref:Acyltransferase n=1 Tax=Callorhinus ursinus TaxID=34884 RepID=A0A3Q7NHX3_CALUR|nr:LOW QUALITY PROTEIN: putative diacylglycerol O-acyltransferase 2-like protein DGAT2L7P [Callorhinus ursinus]
MPASSSHPAGVFKGLLSCNGSSPTWGSVCLALLSRAGTHGGQEATDLPGSAAGPSGDISEIRSLSSLVKTAELDPSGNYLFGFHPHRVLVTGAFSNFCTEATGFSSLFPRLLPYLLMLPCWFYLPLFRDYIMCIRAPSPLPPGLVSSDKASGCLSVVPAWGAPGGGPGVGGPLEAPEAKAGELLLWIRNQKGFVPLARELGHNELFQQFPNPPGSRLRSAQEALPPLLSVALPLFQGPLGLLLPFRTPIHTVEGAPIPVQRSPRPSREQVDALHALSVERLAQRFDERKARHGLAAHPHLLLARRPRRRCDRREIQRGNRAAVCACLCGAVPPGDLDSPGGLHPDPGRAAGACPAALQLPRSQRSFWPLPAAGTRGGGAGSPSSL